MHNNKLYQTLSTVRLLLFLTIGLLSFGVTSKTWFRLHINLTGCTQCGEIIVTIGNAFDEMLVTGNFIVQEYVRVYAGIWGVSVCTAERLCLDMKLCEAEKMFGFLQIFSRLFGKCFIFYYSSYTQYFEIKDKVYLHVCIVLINNTPAA